MSLLLQKLLDNYEIIKIATNPLEKSNMRASTNTFKVRPNNNQMGQLPKAAEVYLFYVCGSHGCQRQAATDVKV
jgi:hypothetical protein